MQSVGKIKKASRTSNGKRLLSMVVKATSKLKFEFWLFGVGNPKTQQ
jgi:hypothetical protein